MNTLFRRLRELRYHHLALAGAAVFGALACATALYEEGLRGTEPQGWWDGRGPVVPHDTFPADCSLCHVSENWYTLREDFTYDHLAETGVALLGAHARAECLRCHNDRGPVELFAARGCAGCHEDVHQGEMGANCEDCHDPDDWRVEQAVALHASTRFPLIGAHVATACWRCHPGSQVGDFQPIDAECVSCHMDDLARATDPDHQALGLVDDCGECHRPTTWTGAGFRHPGFPIGGAHDMLDCADCHLSGIFGGTPEDCFGCHMADYQNAQDPDHVANNFPTSCEDCHGVFTWEGAQFNHQGITTGCIDCHLDDYNATNDPDHASAGFPLDCEVCHTTQQWEGATFTHPGFPITSGDHKNLDCADCHQVPTSYAIFTCTDCHEHTKPDMDDEHDDVRNYVYESTACLMCHPDGDD